MNGAARLFDEMGGGRLAPRIERQKRKPRRAGGVVFALREQSIQSASPREAESGEAETEQCKRGGFRHYLLGNLAQQFDLAYLHGVSRG